MTGDSNSFDVNPDITWTDSEELIIRDLGMRAKRNCKLTDIAHSTHSKLLTGFNISIGVISGVTGLLSFATDKIPSTFTYWSIVVGTVSFSATILASVSQILKLSDKVGKFKYTKTAWGKMARDIEIVLALKRNGRPKFTTFLENVRSQFNELSENMTDVTVNLPDVSVLRTPQTKDDGRSTDDAIVVNVIPSTPKTTTDDVDILQIDTD